ncbi:MAG TPA: peptidylprolyl isomerase [Polyangiaceae bacterium]
MPRKVWAYCVVLATLAWACASKPPAPPQTSAQTVVVDLGGSQTSARSAEARLPALGAATAPVTIVALVAFSDAESAATYQALRRLQARLGEPELRLVLVTPGVGESGEVMADTLQQNHGDAAYFDFAARMFDEDPPAFGDALKLALEVSRAHAQDSRKAGRDSSAPIVQAEADALREAAEPVIPALSVNGIRVFGRLPPAQLEALVSAEYQTARALGRTGIAVRAIYPERVAGNADRVVRREAPALASPPDETAQGAALHAPASDAPQRVTASHILFAYQGALRASPEIARSKADARALAAQVLGDLKQGALTFDEAVARYSDEPGAAQRQGALGSFGRNAMVKPFADAAFALKPGDLSGVVETDFGFHIIWRQQ